MRLSNRRAAVLPLVVSLCLVGCGGEPPVNQPLVFNHKVHKDQQVDCSACHEYYRNATYSGIPTTDTCTLCHDADAKAPELQKLARYVAAGEEIPWKRIYGIPGHVFYSHRRHVETAKIACAECHGAIGESAEPPKYALVDQSMQWCLDCHQERGASTDCIHCHR